MGAAATRIWCTTHVKVLRTEEKRLSFKSHLQSGFTWQNLWSVVFFTSYYLGFLKHIVEFDYITWTWGRVFLVIYWSGETMAYFIDEMHYDHEITIFGHKTIRKSGGT